MPVAIQIPNVRAAGAPGGPELAEMLRQVDTAGFHSAWVMEHQLGAASALEPLTTLAFAAGHTSSVRLGLAVAILALHHPVRLAREVATIDHLSDGRMTLGVGIGAAGLPWEAFGEAASDRAARFEEYLDVMRRLWDDSQVDVAGRFVALRHARMEPKPVQRPMPVWFGASSPRALRRTARLASGWLGAGSSVRGFPSMVSQLRSTWKPKGETRAPSPSASACTWRSTAQHRKSVNGSARCMGLPFRRMSRSAEARSMLSSSYSSREGPGQSSCSSAPSATTDSSSSLSSSTCCQRSAETQAADWLESPGVDSFHDSRPDERAVVRVSSTDAIAGTSSIRPLAMSMTSSYASSLPSVRRIPFMP